MAIFINAPRVSTQLRNMGLLDHQKKQIIRRVFVEKIC